MPNWEWTDARYFLAVARDGATLRAANRLGVNQTTCARRIAALEDALQLKLFARSGSGYQLTDAGLALVPLAEALDAAATSFEAAAGALGRERTRALRLTTAEGFEKRLVAPALATARRRLPGLVCEIDVSAERRDLVRGDADIAVRAGLPPQEPGVIYRRLQGIEWGIYSHASYPRPVTIANFAEHPLASIEGQPLDVLRHMAPEGRVVQITTTFMGLVATLRAGDCVAGLPTFIGDHEPDLIRHALVEEEEGPAIWIVYPERLRGAADVRVLIDCLVEQVGVAAKAA
jgi:DNA-binding transcriptional LysR family regulator